MAVPAIYKLRSSNSALLTMCFVLVWICGIVLGCSIYEPFSASLMRSAIQEPVSIVGVFVCFILPILCTYFSFITKKPIIAMIVCFLKAVAYGYTTKVIMSCFASACWLVHILFLFSDSCLLFLLLFVWIHHHTCQTAQQIRSICFCSVWISVIVLADVYVIGPFLEGLF